MTAETIRIKFNKPENFDFSPPGVVVKKPEIQTDEGCCNAYLSGSQVFFFFFFGGGGSQPLF